jgi:hypothetical protein
MELSDKLRDLAVSETGFVFDPYTGATFSANPAALTLLLGLKDGLGRDGLRARLEESFEVGDRDLERDLDEFFDVLRRQGLVPADREL